MKVACWMYFNEYTSLSQVPYEELGGIALEFSNAILQTFIVEVVQF